MRLNPKAEIRKKFEDRSFNHEGQKEHEVFQRKDAKRQKRKDRMNGINRIQIYKFLQKETEGFIAENAEGTENYPRMNAGFGVRRHVRALRLGDMSPSGKAATCRRTPNYFRRHSP